MHTLGLGIETWTLSPEARGSWVLCLLGHWLAKLPRAVCMGPMPWAVHLVNFPMRSWLKPEGACVYRRAFCLSLPNLAIPARVST